MTAELTRSCLLPRRTGLSLFHSRRQRLEGSSTKPSAIPTVLPILRTHTTDATHHPPLQTYQDVRPSSSGNQSSGSSSNKSSNNNNNSGSSSADLLLPHNTTPLSHRAAGAHARRPRGAGPAPPLPDRLPPGRAAVRGHDHEGKGARARRRGRPPPERRRAARRADA